jgi:glyoxylase-like metal-dependent hydrolase (beta-lactamase superfamily II)
MSLTKISGHTYFIPGPTNVGVFTTKSGYCVIVDTGLDNNAGRRLNDILNAAGLKPKIVINTHAHPDHFGANTILKSLNPGLEVWVPPFERLFIENAGLEAYSMYGAAPYREMRSNLLHAKACEVDNTLNLGVADLLDKAFQVMALPGHTLGQIGIITPDKVAFIADSLFSTEILEKYSMPFLQDIKQQLNTLETLLNLDAEHLLQSHSTGLITDLSRTVNSNKKKHTKLHHYDLGIIGTAIDTGRPVRTAYCFK